MLAPRKRLWSTPLSAVDVITQQWIPKLHDGDKIVDIGCGDGRILLEWAKRITNEDTNGGKDINISFLGLDIDPNRIASCREALETARQEERIAPFLSIEFICANALETTHWMKDGAPTIVFLYLIPRGLQLITPILRQINQPKETDVDNHPSERSPQHDSDCEETTILTQQVTVQQPPSSFTKTIPQKKLRVISYMAKLPGESVKDRALLTVDHQPGAQWPLYFYELD